MKKKLSFFVIFRYMVELNKIYCCDCIDLMKNIDDMITSRTKLTQKELDKIKREKRDFFYDKKSIQDL